MTPSSVSQLKQPFVALRVAHFLETVEEFGPSVAQTVGFGAGFEDWKRKMNRDLLPTNDDSFFASPEPNASRKKWSMNKLGFIALGLLVLTILGNFASQPVASLIEYLMLPAETKETIRSGKIPGVKSDLPPQTPLGGW